MGRVDQRQKLSWSPIPTVPVHPHQTRQPLGTLSHFCSLLCQYVNVSLRNLISSVRNLLLVCDKLTSLQKGVKVSALGLSAVAWTSPEVPTSAGQALLIPCWGLGLKNLCCGLYFHKLSCSDPTSVSSLPVCSVLLHNPQNSQTTTRT